MWKRARWFIPVLVVLIVILILLVERTAREKLPTQELTNAENAVAEAKEKEADLYAPDLFAKAQESLKRAKDLVLEKKYKEAKEAAEAAAGFAQQAISQGELNRSKMKSEAEQMIAEVRKGINDLKRFVSKFRKKMTGRERKELTERIPLWEKEIADIEKLIKANKIRQAYDQVATLKKDVNSLHERFIPSPEEEQGIK
jgi:hypothetical protein